MFEGVDARTVTAFWSPLEQLVVGRVSVTNRSYQKALW